MRYISYKWSSCIVIWVQCMKWFDYKVSLKTVRLKRVSVPADGGGKEEPHELLTQRAQGIIVKYKVV